MASSQPLKRGYLSTVVVFDQRLYMRPDGMVFSWCQKVTNRFGTEAVGYAPVRTGELKAGIHWNTIQTGERQVVGRIGSTANHTMFVLRGTGTPGKGRDGSIYTTRGFANPSGSVVTLWGVVDPKTNKFSRTGKGRRERHQVRVKGYWMVLPAWEHFKRGWADEVSGQEPNNFLLKAWRATARNHKALRGSVPSWISHP